MNYSEQWVLDRLAVAGMPDYMQGFLMNKTISLGVALALNEIEDEKVKYEWTVHAADNGMTVPAAQNALREWEKIERRRQEMPEGAELPEVPIVPPIVHAQCARCNVSRPIGELRFVRICNPDCPGDSQG